MSAVVVHGQVIPAHLRVLANDILRWDAASQEPIASRPVRRWLTDDSQPPQVPLALRIEVQHTILSSLRHARLEFETEFDYTSSLAMTLWVTGNAEWLTWAKAPSAGK